LIRRYGIGIGGNKWNALQKKQILKDWDNETPTKEYFEELFRVSKNQIIWGGNYFFNELGNTKTFLIWDKKIAEDMSFAMCELAWTSFRNGAKIFKETATQIQRIHPTQKPVASFTNGFLDKYAKEGDKILDTHLGSGSIAIACHDYGFNLTACELDKEYFDKAMERLNNHMAQQKLF
jgi:site-specific DNA-methyltransferase (adenine-specific)